MTTRRYPSSIVGLPFPNRDGDLCHRVARDLAVGDVVDLEREADNPQDAGAVAVFVPAHLAGGERRQAGWVPKRHACWIGEQLDEGRTMTATVAAIHVRGATIVNVDLDIDLERRR